jgi:hypothetical protein
MESNVMTATCTLDDFALESDRSDGLTIETLDAGVTLAVKTSRSSYRIIILDGRRHVVMVEGGVFPEAAVLRLSGATAGGSALKLGWILVGFRMEFAIGNRHVTSSRVQSVAIESAPADSPGERGRHH